MENQRERSKKPTVKPDELARNVHDQHLRRDELNKAETRGNIQNVFTETGKFSDTHIRPLDALYLPPSHPKPKNSSITGRYSRVRKQNPQQDFSTTADISPDYACENDSEVQAPVDPASLAETVQLRLLKGGGEKKGKAKKMDAESEERDVAQAVEIHPKDVMERKMWWWQFLNQEKLREHLTHVERVRIPYIYAKIFQHWTSLDLGEGDEKENIDEDNSMRFRSGNARFHFETVFSELGKRNIVLLKPETRWLRKHHTLMGNYEIKTPDNSSLERLLRFAAETAGVIHLFFEQLRILVQMEMDQDSRMHSQITSDSLQLRQKNGAQKETEVQLNSQDTLKHFRESFRKEGETTSIDAIFSARSSLELDLACNNFMTESKSSLFIGENSLYEASHQLRQRSLKEAEEFLSSNAYKKSAGSYRII